MSNQEPVAYVIEFNDTLGCCYAGVHEGAVAFASSIRTATLFETEESASNTLKNGYGRGAQANATVRPVLLGEL